MKYNEPLWKCGKMYLNEPDKMCLNELQWAPMSNNEHNKPQEETVSKKEP